MAYYAGMNQGRPSQAMQPRGERLVEASLAGFERGKTIGSMSSIQVSCRDGRRFPEMQSWGRFRKVKGINIRCRALIAGGTCGVLPKWKPCWVVGEFFVRTRRRRVSSDPRPILPLSLIGSLKHPLRRLHRINNTSHGAPRKPRCLLLLGLDWNPGIWRSTTDDNGAEHSTLPDG